MLVWESFGGYLELINFRENFDEDRIKYYGNKESRPLSFMTTKLMSGCPAVSRSQYRLSASHWAGQDPPKKSNTGRLKDEYFELTKCKGKATETDWHMWEKKYCDLKADDWTGSKCRSEGVSCFLWGGRVPFQQNLMTGVVSFRWNMITLTE